MKKRLILIILIGAMIAGAAFLYVWYKPHRNIQNEKSKFSLTAGSLHEAYLADEANANSLYLDKTIEISGTISDVKEGIIILNDLVVCNLLEGEGMKAVQLGQGKKVSIKGRVTGFDELFEEVRMDQCSFNE